MSQIRVPLPSYFRPRPRKQGRQQANDLTFPETNFCVCRDISHSPNNAHPPTIVKPPKTSKSSHRRARPSIDKKQVSKPLPALAYNEREVFIAMASGNAQTRLRAVPKAAEKKVKINPLELIKSSPPHKPKVPADTPSRSWYTPTAAQSPSRNVLLRSTSTTTPRALPFKVDVGRTNSNKESKGRGRVDSEARRDGVGPGKRRVDKQSISHPDCPWIDPADVPTVMHGCSGQHQPEHSETRGSFESENTAIDSESLIRVDAKRGKPTRLAKPVEDTVRPTVRLIGKPLPDLPALDSLSSRSSASTGSVYSDGDPFSYDQLLNMFPNPPQYLPNALRLEDLDNCNSLSTPAFMSCPNTSSSSVETVIPVSIPETSPVKPLMLKTVPKPKIATVVHQNPRASYSFSQLPDSIDIQRRRAHSRAPVKGGIHPTIRTADPTPTPRRRSASFNSSSPQNESKRARNLYELLWPNRRQTDEEKARLERARQQRDREYQLEQQREQEKKLFELEFGFNPHYKGKKSYEQEVDPDGFELIKQEPKRRWL